MALLLCEGQQTDWGCHRGLQDYNNNNNNNNNNKGQFVRRRIMSVDITRAPIGICIYVITSTFLRFFGLYTTCFGPLHHHVRLPDDRSRLQPDNQPDLYSIISTLHDVSTQRPRSTRPIVYSIFIRPVLDRYSICVKFSNDPQLILDALKSA